jgi:outer membrane protein assembly factor BamB
MSIPSRLHGRPLTLALGLLCLAPPCFGQTAAPPPGSSDWLVWGGPQRDFRSAATGLADSWPATGPRRIWTRTLGEGFSAAAIEGSRLYTMYSVGGREVVTALDAGTGKTVWEHAYPTDLSEGAGQVGAGPYAMPQVVGERVVAVGGTGKLHVLDKLTGKPIWSHDLYKEFGADRKVYGYACQALPYRDTLIMTIGGRGKSIIAFDQKDGRVVWGRHAFNNGHSSPLLINVDGQEQVVAFMGQQVVGVDPKNGDLLWQHAHPIPYDFAISTPVWGPDNVLVVSAAYDAGTRALHLAQQGGRTKVKELWFNPRVKVHFGTMIRVGDTLYAASGHSGPAPVTALDVKTGKVLWQSGREFAKAQLLLADGKLIILDEDGVLALATATPEGLKAHSRVPLLSKVAWTPPSLAGTRLFVRDRTQLMALELGR